MGRYVARRLLQLIPILLGITILTFALMQMASGDAVDAMIEQSGIAITPEAEAQMRAELGLDQPLWQQYLTWLFDVLHGDMGTSYVSGVAVMDSFSAHLPYTILLALSSLLLTILISFPLGVWSAVKQSRLPDFVIRVFSFIGNALPGFFVALLLLYLFSVRLKLLPTIYSQGDWRCIILPTLTLAIAMSAKYIRQIRSTVLDEFGRDYIEGLRSRGVRERVILCKSVLKSSLLTINTLLALSLGSLLGGTAIVESIFMWPGVGKMAVDAIMMRDYPIIEAYVMWMAIIFVCVNLIADILYHVLDPRIRLEGART
ncbi:MAG: nickel ABC transporter permease [Coriobacteriales bacterium]|jgi:peptide/nickel transport system permease protein